MINSDCKSQSYAHLMVFNTKCPKHNSGAVIIFKQVYDYLHQNKILSKDQSGFRPNDSTVNPLSFMYDEFCKALDAKKYVRIVFCDISKPFDKVWHQGMLYQLRRVEIKGDLLNWFKDNLTDREQRGAASKLVCLRELFWVP